MVFAVFACVNVFETKDKQQAANADTVGTKIDLGTTTAQLSSNLPNLYKVLGSSSTTTYSALDSAITKTNGTVLKTGFTGNYVSLGGYNWNIMAVSRNSSGDLVATLWMATSLETYKWNDWYENNTGYTYPSSMYSSSKIRSRLVGTKFVASASAANSAPAGASVQHTNLKSFITTYTSVLDAPEKIAYQGTESPIGAASAGGVNFTYSTPNDAYGTPRTSNWYSSGYNYSGKGSGENAYSAWKSDKLWLPSITETGYNDTYNGLWKTTQAQRKNTAANTYTWLRSGSYNYAN